MSENTTTETRKMINELGAELATATDPREVARLCQTIEALGNALQR